MKNIPKSVKGIIDRIKGQQQKKSSKYYAQCHVDAALEQIVNLKCKSCNSAFIDYTGCLSIQCRCEKHFCGLCLQSFSDSKSCHSHVLRCRWNVDEYLIHSENYFMTNTQWKRLQQTRIAWNLWKYAWTVYFETRSLLFTIGVMSRLSSHVSILPWCVSEILQKMWSTETFALFTIIALIFRRPVFLVVWIVLTTQKILQSVAFLLHQIHICQRYVRQTCLAHKM